MNKSTTHKPSSCCVSNEEPSQYIDPVCGMSVDNARPDLHYTFEGVDLYFCSTNCLRIFQLSKNDTNSGMKPIRAKNLGLLAGILGGAALVAVFLGVIFVIASNGSTGFAISEIKRLWYWVMLLAAGFGIQLGLFVHIRHMVRQRLTAAKAELAASGAVSTGSMVACCSHGLIALLPFLGISAAAAFLARYQLSLLLLGLFSNLLGVTVMIGLAQKNSIIFSNSILKFLAGLNMKALRIFLVVAGLVAIGVSFASS